MILQHQTITDSCGAYEEYYHLPPEQIAAIYNGARFQVLREQWLADGTVRHIYEVKLENDGG